MNYDSARTRPIGLYAVMVGVLSVIALDVNAQTPLTELPKGAAPCEFYSEWQEKLEWDERQFRENSLAYWWVDQNREGQTGLCNRAKGFPDSCGRVSWVARLNSKREVIGWALPDRVQAIYHFEGGVTTEDLCYGAR